MRIPCVMALMLMTALPAGCREGDFTGVPAPGGIMVVHSDPGGASIFLDGRSTGLVTPDTLRELSPTVHDVGARLEGDGVVYSYTARVQVAFDSAVSVSGPLLLRCGSSDCAASAARYHEGAGIRFATSPAGLLLHLAGQGAGLFWPAGTENSYASVGAPVFAGVPQGIPDTLALGPYDPSYLAGRPAPTVVDEGGRFALRQSTWIVPPGQLIQFATVRGIAIEQEVVASTEVQDVVLVRLSFRNITADPLYQLLDPQLPSDGFTYESAYIGFVLDADVGEADDDLLSYDPDLDLAFVYDSDFREAGYSGEWADGPGLIGMRVLAAPPGATVILNGWPQATAQRTLDWSAGSIIEPEGWGWLSGTHTLVTNHPHPRIGFADATPTDVRVSVSAGPVTLAPGDSAVLTLAVMVAPPVQGMYTSGTVLAPGDPTDTDRALLQAAALLLERARAAEALIDAGT